MVMNQKLELTWIGKDQQPQLEPRILIEDREKSFGDRNSLNMLIHGDNLLALKALEQDFTGKIKCACIDPPYNTGNAFDHYDDSLEHSTWLNLIKPRIELLHRLLSDDGSLWIYIDDDECHYLKILCDEIFGRKNFVNNVIWEKKYTVSNDAKYFSDNHDHILVYAKNKDLWKINRIPRTIQNNKAYKNPDNHSKGPWKSTPLQAKSGSDPDFYHEFPNGITWRPPKGRYSAYAHETLNNYFKANEIWFGKSGKSTPSRKTFLSELKSEGVVPRTLWRFDEVGHNHEAKTEVKAFNPEDVFSTPKPERLLERVITLASIENEFILDSFLGSGTTSAVAHKMGRNWIGIELGDHCKTHCLPRLKKVVTGEDQGGISKSVDWKGGGGFKYYYLAPSLLQKDKYDNWVIEKSYNPEMLAAAMSKHEGFRFNPDEHAFWKQGQSTERDFIFTTTTFITVEYLDKIHEEMKPEETLLICCRAFQEPCQARYNNINIRKIPSMLLGRCEFGKEDYSLNIVNVPLEIEQELTSTKNTPFEIKSDTKKSSTGKKEKNQDTSEPTLF
jgi:adenine-specific DNA-methyltransferase